ncbi:hypothetical protein IH992_28470 [Candidatus Poribacteria bacterium]|nr:hypothetical protein [Candidatus Poribacteria bacterium]
MSRFEQRLPKESDHGSFVSETRLSGQSPTTSNGSKKPTRALHLMPRKQTTRDGEIVCGECIDAIMRQVSDTGEGSTSPPE